MLSYEEALAKLLAAAVPVPEYRVLPLTAVAGRVLAAPAVSAINVPPLANSGMDGYAVRAADIPAPGAVLRVTQRIPAGSVGEPLEPGTAARIFTGAPIPPGADAVVMQEDCQAAEGTVTVNAVPRGGDNIRPAGEDIAAGAAILPAGLKLRPQDVALAAAAGIPELPVYRRLRVGVFFTGDELCQPGEALKAGGIYNSNRFALRAFLEGLNCEVRDLGQVPDNLEATRDALRRAAADNDLIVTSGGVSVGEEDHVKPAVEAEGRIDMWKIAMKPGKPLAFGEIGKGERLAWFIGLPGNPVSAMVTFMIMVRPFVLRLQGVTDVAPRSFALRSDSDWSRPDARAEFLRARTNDRGGVDLYPNQGAGVASSLVWGDGLVMNPPGHPIATGEIVRFVPYSELLS